PLGRRYAAHLAPTERLIHSSLEGEGGAPLAQAIGAPGEGLLRRVALGKAVALIGDREASVLLRLHLEPERRSVMRGRRNGVGARRRCRNRLHRDRRQRLVISIGDEHSRYGVFLPRKL